MSAEAAEILLRARNATEQVFREAERDLAALGHRADKTKTQLRSLGTEGASSMNRMGVAAKDLATSMLGALTLDRAFQGALNFGRDLLQMADDIQKAADKTGLTTDQVQRLQYVSSQTSVSLETMVGAVQNLTQRLGEGDKGAVGGLKKLGINLDEFLAMNPYDQLMSVADGLHGVKDQSEFASVAADVFGKSWKELAPAVRDNMRQLANNATTWSDGTQQALVKAGDAWAHFTHQIKVFVAESYNTAGRLFDQMNALISRGTAAIFDGAARIADAVAKMPGGEKLLGSLGVNGNSLREQAQWFRDRATLLLMNTEATVKLTTVTNPMAGAMARAAIAKREAAEAAKLLEKQYRENGRAADEWMRKQAEHEKRLVKFKELITENAEALTRKPPILRDLAAAQAIAAKTADETVSAWRRSRDGVVEFTDTVIHRVRDAGIVTTANLRAQAEAARKLYADMVAAGDLFTKADIENARKRAEEAERALNGTRDAWKQFTDDLKNIGSQTGRDIAALLGDGIKTGDWSQFENNLKDTLARGMGAAAAAAVNAVVPGLGSILEPLFGGLSDKFLGALGLGTKGRDLVKGFVDQEFGSFDGFQHKLQELVAQGKLTEDAAHRMWVSLTQGVGRDNPQQAKRVIEDIQKTLQNLPLTMAELATAAGFKTTAELQKVADEALNLWKFMRDSGEYSADAVRQAWERAQQALLASGDQQAIAAQKALDHVKKLDDEIKSLEASIANEAPEEVMGVVEAQARARLEALKREREAAAKHVEEMQAGLTDSMREVAAAIDRIPREIEINVRTLFEGHREPVTVPHHEEGTSVLRFVRNAEVAIVTSADTTTPALVFA